MNTGQTVYEQLQDILIKCIELGWKPMGHEWNGDEYEIYCNEGNSPFIDFVSQGLLCFSISYHDVFSKDSGLMEFVDGKKKGGLYGLHYSYESMCTLTAHEKVTWFINNTIIPTK